MPHDPPHQPRNNQWSRRLREEAVFWLSVLAYLAQELTLRVARRVGPFVRTVPPAGQAAWRDAAIAFGVFRREELPALWARLRPLLVATRRTMSRFAIATARTGRRAGGSVVRATRPYAVRAVGGLTVLLLLAWFLPGPVLWAASHAVDSNLPPLQQRSTVVAADGTVLGTLHDGVNRAVVPLEDVPPLARRLVILAEDRRFWQHDGYDMRGMLRALTANLRSGEVEQGGSTITQQIAKQNFTGSSRNVFRKIREVVHAVSLERHVDKEELLERYLNQVYFGAGAYGIAAAAEEYFGVTPRDLTPAQAALLAGLIRAPVRIDPRDEPDTARRFRDLILESAAEAGVLGQDEARMIQAEPVELLPPRPNEVPPIVDTVVRSFLSDPAFGRTRTERARRLYTGGLRIETTIDPRLQRAAEDAVAASMRDGAPGAALAVVDPATGEVRALASAGPREVASLDLATQARRQPGSAMKPLVALAALEAGLTTFQRLEGSGPVEFQGGPEPWRVENYGRRDYGSVDLGEALVKSVNTAFAQLGVALGPDAIARVADRAGVDVDAALGPPQARGPSIALGGLHHGVSPLELASAYGVFSTGGMHARPTMVSRVFGPDGDARYRHRPRTERVAPDAHATTIRDMLVEAVERGTGRRARLDDGWQVAGKTGTTQNAADAWFVGVVPGLAAAAWVGHPTEAVAMPDATGGSLAAPLWRDFMTAALEGFPPTPFPPPPPGSEDALGDEPIELHDPERVR